MVVGLIKFVFDLWHPVADAFATKAGPQREPLVT